MKELILGGARSGKSRYAEQRATESGLEVIYIATARADDEEMALRIGHHRDRRPNHWMTAEAPTALACALQHHAALHRCLIVDCLTLWLSNILADQQGNFTETLFRAERQALLDTLPTLPGKICLVSNEVGQGVVPVNPLARRFVDEAGWLHQALAQQCDRVVFLTVGLPQILKEPPRT